jgi:farnesyl diphosphate synthase
VSLLGLDGARAKAESLLRDAETALEDFGENAALLREIASFIVHRDR